MYGTLLAGEKNHALLARSRLAGSGRTRPEYSLHDLGAHPAVAAGGTTAIEGEIYEVDAETLARLDALEHHPDWYRRTAITLADGTPVETYLLPASGVHGCALIAGGSWRNRFVPRP